MREHGGSVINISSIGGISGMSGIGTYNVTKGGVIHLTKVLAEELAPGVNVNAIARDSSRPTSLRVVEPLDDDVAANLVLPEDIADAAVFLGSDGVTHHRSHAGRRRWCAHRPRPS
jgi:NAD(P)-dependent dehydrogenase (short-subunit alcohol dehydrogenase family)